MPFKFTLRWLLPSQKFWCIYYTQNTLLPLGGGAYYILVVITRNYSVNCFALNIILYDFKSFTKQIYIHHKSIEICCSAPKYPVYTSACRWYNKLFFPPTSNITIWKLNRKMMKLPKSILRDLGGFHGNLVLWGMEWTLWPRFSWLIVWPLELWPMISSGLKMNNWLWFSV